jgi:hypothetical protein
MLKLRFIKQNTCPITKKEYYDSINRIPLKISFDDYFPRPESIYTRNYFDNNLIEIGFAKSNGFLLDITLVSFNNDSIVNEELNINLNPNEFFRCKLSDSQVAFLDNRISKIYKGSSYICISFDDLDLPKLTFFQCGEHIYLGTDDNGFLKSIVFNRLSIENLYSIFGF